MFKLDPEDDALSRGVHPTEMIYAIKRDYKMILGLLIVFLSLSVLYLMLSVPQYRAEAKIILDLRKDSLLDDKVNFRQFINNTPYLKAQVQIITSYGFLKKVMEALSLDKDTEFQKEKSLLSKTFSSPLENNQYFDDLVNKQYVIDQIKQRLSVEVMPRTHVISIHFRSIDPIKSKKIVDQLITIYMEDALNFGFEDRIKDIKWVKKNIAQIQENIHKNYQKLYLLQKKSGFFSSSSGEKGKHQISALNQQLITRQSVLAGKRSTFNEVNRLAATGNNNYNIAHPSDYMMLLIMQRSDLQSEISALQGRYAQNHPKFKAIKQQIKSIESLIQKEKKSALERLKIDVNIADKTQKYLLSEMTKQEKKLGKSQAQHPQIKQLQDDILVDEKAVKGLNEKLIALSAQIMMDKDIKHRSAGTLLPITPSSPKVGPVIFLAICGAIFSAIMIMALRKFYVFYKSHGPHPTIENVAE